MIMRKVAGSLAASLLACAFGVFAGCAPAIYSGADSTIQTVKGFIPSGDLHTHAVKSIKQVKVGRIAVMPIIANPGPNGDVVAEGAAEALTAELFTTAATQGGWDVVPQDDIARAMQNLPPTTPEDFDQNALKLGHDLSVDGVLYGMVERYREREGLDYAAAEPASVSFTLKFVDLNSKQVVWSAKFAKSQKALSQNIFELANFVQHKARWVRAHEIANEGVQEAVANLHGSLNLSADVKRFETGSYGQLKSGQQRYTTGVQGIY